MAKAMTATKSLKAIKSKKSVKKAMKSTSKGALADALANACELKEKDVSAVLDHLAEVATKQVKADGVFTIPGVARVKTCRNPTTKARKREMVGKVVKVKARPARTVVKAFPVAALKANF